VLPLAAVRKAENRDQFLKLLTGATDINSDCFPVRKRLFTLSRRQLTPLTSMRELLLILAAEVRK